MSKRDMKKQKKLNTKACSGESTTNENACGSKTDKSCGTSKRCK